MCSSRNRNTRNPVMRWPRKTHWPALPLYRVLCVIGSPPPAAAPLTGALCLPGRSPPARSFAHGVVGPAPAVPAVTPHGGAGDVHGKAGDDEGDGAQGDG